MIEKLRHEHLQLNQMIEQLKRNEMDLTQAKNALAQELACSQDRLKSLGEEE